MVVAVRSGDSLRSVASRFSISAPTVARWVDRAQGKRLDRVDFSDRPDIPIRAFNRTGAETEALVLRLRKELRETSVLGEYGAVAILREMETQRTHPIPSIRTIGYILQRNGMLDHTIRRRTVPPPPGWHLPEVAGKLCELDQFDFVEGLVIKGGPEIEVLNAISLHGGLAGAWPETGCTAVSTCRAMIEHWKHFGLPGYAQFDNDTRFQGPHSHPDVIGAVVRLCLGLGVIPVFAPPREQGMQNSIEGFNSLWQSKVWVRFHHESLEALREQSDRYIGALRVRRAARIGDAPARSPFPSRWKFDKEAKISSGSIIFIRRTSDRGAVSVLGRSYPVADHWLHRLVKCIVDINEKVIRCYALRRVEPGNQPLLREIPYSLPERYLPK